MRLFLGSGGFRTPERVCFFDEQLRLFLGPVGRVLFIPYALADHDGYLRRLTERGLNGGYELDGIHRHADPARAVREAEAVFVGGGNTFRLLDALYRLGLLDPLRQRARAGMPYVGVSAGTNVACPTVRTTNDMPIVQPPALDALGLAPFQVNPHYFFGPTYWKQGEEWVEHFGETRDDRIREFHEESDLPVLGLWEGGVLRHEDGRWALLGAPARLFRKGREPLDLAPGDDLQAALG